jgi:hypothetical protein
MDYKYMGNDTFKYVENDNNRYIVLRHCEICGNPFYTNKYQEVSYCTKKCAPPKRGRPIGHKLKEKVKNKISESRVGQKHAPETIKKISKAVAKTSNIFNAYRDWEGNFIHGENTKNSCLYRKWTNINSRCYNPNNKNYKYYGGRGIKVCDEWREFIPFKEWSLSNGYKPGLHIDRIDNNLGYFPDNCRFLTASEHGKKTALDRSYAPKN